MARSPSPAIPPPPPSGAPRPATSPPSLPALGPEDFPGCEPFHLPAAELAYHECRLEFWDGRTQTAWRVADPTTIDHELPSRRLPWLARTLASLRGSEITCVGSADLVCRDASGRPRWLMQADEALYLHPGRSFPGGSDIDVERDPLPDVVLEVDYTTDVRRQKLSIYTEWGFPEVWVLVPPGSRRAGYPRVTIYRPEGKGYRTVGESGAIPGFANEEIFRALIERPWTQPTWRAVERVARAMGEREGTGPEDDPLSGSLIRDSKAQGHREGMAQGHREGRAQGRAETVRDLLRSRSVATSPGFEEALRALVADTPSGALMAAALACTDEADFLRRIRMHAPPEAGSG